MTCLKVSGIELDFDLIGPAGAQAIALTPGGRMSKDTAGLRELAEALAEGGLRVLLWDRPNCGASDLFFGDETESHLQGRILTELIRSLDLGPTALAGGSAGSRCSLLAAVHDPGAVSHLVQWWISGGTVGSLMLGASYACEPAIAASMGGMAAVAALPTFAEPLKRNPANSNRLLAMDPHEFIAVMERWASAFVPTTESPVPGMSAADFGKLTMPMLIFRGSPDDLYHPRRIGDWVHELVPHSQVIDPPWSEDAFARRMIEAARTGSGHLADWPLLAPAILDFLAR